MPDSLQTSSVNDSEKAPNQLLHTKRRHVPTFRILRMIGRWIRCHRPVPAAVGELSFAKIARSPCPSESCSLCAMKAAFTYWKESDGRYLGYLNDYPDHWTQGEDLEDLKEQLRGLYHTFGAEQIPGIRKVEELELA